MKRIVQISKFSLKIVLLIFLISVTIENKANADNRYGISGQVKDEKTNSALEFCSVRIFNLNDSLITGAVTDSKGYFTTLLSSGNYRFLIEYLGYESDTVEIAVTKENEFVGVFKLTPFDNTVDGVVINGSTRENLIDKEVYLVTEDMRKGAADTKDVLSRVKGVEYDRYNNTIKVEHSDNIVILVNGLEKDQEYILNLNPERLKDIEIIKDPSGRYGLEGYTAVINIVLKEDYKGTEFYISERILLDPDTKDIDYFVAVNNLTATFNYTYNKLNFYSKVSDNLLNIDINTFSDKVYDSGFEVKSGSFDNSSNMTGKRNNDNYTVGADYYINPKHTVSFESNYSGLIYGTQNFINNGQLKYLQDGLILSDFNISQESNSKRKNSSYSLFYVGKLNQNNTLHIDMTYSHNGESYSNAYFIDGIQETNESGLNNTGYTRFNTEYIHDFNVKSSLQTGYGMTWKKMNNLFSPVDLNSVSETDQYSDEFNFTDLRHKFYVYYSYNFNKKYGIKLGAAGEISNPEADGLKTSYIIYQPYLDIKMKPLEVLDINIKYRASDDYPSIDQANPFTILIDQQSIRIGNPYLSPAVTHKTSVKFDLMQGLLSVEPYYHFSNNYISQIGMLREDGLFEYTYGNVGQYRHEGIIVNLTIPFGKSLFWQNNADLFKSSIEYEGRTNKLSDWALESQLIYMNKKYNSVAGLIYQKNSFKFISTQGYNSWSNDLWGILVQQPFFKNKMNVMLLYVLPLDFAAKYKQESYIQTDHYYESRYEDIAKVKNVILLQVSFRLNKGQTVRKTEKDIPKEENKQNKGFF